MLDNIIKTLSLFLIIFLGYFTKRIKWLSKDDFPMLSKIVLNITLPCMLLTSFHDYKIQSRYFVFALLSLVMIILQSICSYFLNRKKTPKDQAFGILNISGYSMGTFVIPFLTSFYQGTSLMIAAIFDLGNCIAFNGINYSWGLNLANSKKKMTIKSFLKTMFKSAVLRVFILIIFLHLFNLKLPKQVIYFTSTVGNANSFLAMFLIGVGFELHLSSSKLKKVGSIIALRYIIAIVFSVLLWFFMPLPLEYRKILCLLSFAPIPILSSSFTSEAKLDVESSTAIVSLSMIISIIIMTGLILFI